MTCFQFTKLISCQDKFTLLCFSQCRVADQHETNKMTADNLAVVFAPTLMRSNNELCAFADLSQQRKLVEFLILNYHEIF